MKDDAEDIIFGVYSELMEIRAVMGERGLQMGKERARMGERGIMGLKELEGLKFYPLDVLLPPIVKIYLQAKEVNYLLHKLQKSLDAKMDQEHTKPARERFDGYLQDPQQRKKEYDAFLKSQGLRRLEDGRVVEIEQG